MTAVPGATASSRRLEAALAILLGALVVLAYLPVVTFGFTNYDDDSYVYVNAHVAGGPTAENLIWALRSVVVSNWHPVTMISHQIDAGIWGLRPGGHHATSLAIHAANGMLLFVLLSRATGAPWRSFFVAGLFGLHPLNVQAVAWIAQRKTLLSWLFCLVALIPYASWTREKRVRSYASVMGLFALGLLSKPSVVFFPIALALVDVWPLGRPRSAGGREPWGALLAEKLPLAVLSAGCAAMTLFSQGGTGAILPEATLSISMRAANAVHASAAYLARAVWPAGLSVFYPHPLDSLPGGKVAISGFLVVALTLGAVLGRRRFPWAFAGWGFYLLGLLPVVGLVQVGSQAMADRYVYVPLIGVLVVAVLSVAESARRTIWGVRVAASLGILALLTSALATRHHLAPWKDSESLFRAALRVTEGNYVAHANLGHALLSRNALEEAIVHFERALAIAPLYSPAHINLGSALVLRGDLEGGVARYRESVRLDPEDAEVWFHLGRTLFRAGRGEEAVAALETAVEKAPGLRAAWNDLGWALFRLGRFDEAAARLRQALRLAPDARTERNLGAVLLAQGLREEAIEHYRLALQLDPDFAEAKSELEAALSASGSTLREMDDGPR